METIEEFEAFVRDRVVALHMGLPQKISARKLSYAIGQSAGYINKIETGQSLPSLSGLYYICKYFGRCVHSRLRNGALRAILNAL